MVWVIRVPKVSVIREFAIKLSETYCTVQVIKTPSRHNVSISSDGVLEENVIRILEDMFYSP